MMLARCVDISGARGYLIENKCYEVYGIEEHSGAKYVTIKDEAGRIINYYSFRFEIYNSLDKKLDLI